MKGEPAVGGSITVGIVSWNVCEYLAACLDALQPQLLTGDQVVVVDNNSHDGTVERVRASYPWVDLRVNAQNVHYAKGMNQALSDASTDLILALNPDTVPSAGALAETRLALADLTVGAVGFEIQALDGTTVSVGRDRPSLTTTVCRWLLPGSLVDRAVRRRQVPRRGRIEVDGLSGAAFAMRRSDWSSLDGFEEKLPLYAEDIDLFARVRERGLKLVVLAGVPVRHAEGASLGQVRGLQTSAYLGQLAFHLMHDEQHRWAPHVLRIALTIRGLFWRLSALTSRGRRRSDALWRATAYRDARSRIHDTVRAVAEARRS